MKFQVEVTAIEDKKDDKPKDPGFFVKSLFFLLFILIAYFLMQMILLSQ